MAHVNVTPEEVLSKILNQLPDDENDEIEDIASLASDDEIDVAPSKSFNIHDSDDVKGTDQNVTCYHSNQSNSTGSTERRQLTRDRLIHDLESALDK